MSLYKILLDIRLTSRVHECNKHSHETLEVDRMYIFMLMWVPAAYDDLVTHHVVIAMFWETW